MWQPSSELIKKYDTDQWIIKLIIFSLENNTGAIEPLVVHIFCNIHFFIILTETINFTIGIYLYYINILALSDKWPDICNKTTQSLSVV